MEILIMELNVNLSARVTIQTIIYSGQGTKKIVNKHINHNETESTDVILMMQLKTKEKQNRSRL